MTQSAFTHHRLIAAISSLFILDSAIFAASLAPLAGAAVLLGCAGALWVVWSARAPGADDFLPRAVDLKLLGWCLLISLGLFLLSGAGHFFYPATDWLIRDSLLADMTRQWFPIIYRYEDHDYLLRAPLGLYTLPALVGKALGLFAAHIAMLARNTLMFGGFLYLFGRLAGAKPLAAICIFLLFNGLDIIPSLVLAVQDHVPGEPFEMPGTLQKWYVLFGYPGPVSQMFWAPNHSLPAWWFAALALLCARGELDLARVAAMAAPLMFWSPMAVIAAPLFLLYILARAPMRELACPRNWIAAVSGLLFIPVAVYLVTALETIHNQFVATASGFLLFYAVSMVVEAPQLGFVALFWRKVEPAERGLLALAGLSVLVIPALSFGPGNDFATRASIPGLTIIALSFARIVLSLDPAANPLARLAAILIIGLGAFAPGIEISRSLQRRAFAVSDCGFLSAWHALDHAQLPGNYLAPLARAPAWIVAARAGQPPLEVEHRACWPDHPLKELRGLEMTHS